MNMNKKNRVEDYICPTCHVMEMYLAGILCSSGEKLFSNEEFEGVIEYDNDGWA